ncbi:hypothetical protein H9Q69_002206 [Fusarium xylarioides]|uniref:Peptidase C14 caspase domain-containing protein n=1 Tax=Fusarium xylarioides TaxID=221167 RepID=A0A9P7I8B3_9HYPO|nr:hypothetical protein H9Q72_002577 [Fusarium xylarioides]KAG5798798.1 hypothetical protein H9Q69_002206 [Fusarium xylarioides]
MSHKESEHDSALLIGIDNYSSLKLRSLRGAVRDVDKVEKWLTSKNVVPEENIIRLTSKESDKDPTYHNIYGELERLTKMAQKNPGCFIFIHYSGHGSRRPTVLTGSHEKNGVDEILLFQSGYMRDFELGAALDKLAKKAKVFIVLDCCHSGGADRDDEDDPKVRAVNLSNVILDEHEFPRGLVKEQTTKGSTSSWWKRPRDYTLLAACQHDEKAKENDNDKVNGLLTYWMLKGLKTLCAHAGPFTYKRLHRYISANMPQGGQQPVLLGQSDRLIFQKTSLQSNELAFVENVGEPKGTVQITLGAAHCVSVGARFLIYPPTFCPSKSLKAQELAKVTVDNVGGLSCKAVLPDGVGGISRGCVAMALRPGKDHKVPVNFHECNAAEEKGLRKTFSACDNTKALTVIGDESNCAQAFTVTRRGKYFCILDPGMLDIAHLPWIPCDSENAAKEVHRLLHQREHFLRIERLGNPFSGSTEWFFFNRVDRDGNVLDTNDELLEGNLIHFRFTNASHESLYYCIFNLLPDGGIKQILPSSGDGMRSIVRRSHEGLGIRLTVPESLRSTNVTEVLDIYKVFVTTHASYFDMHQTSEYFRGEGYKVLDEMRGDIEEISDGNWQTAQIKLKIRLRQ